MSRRVFSVALDSPRYSETPTASATSAPRPTTAMAVIGSRRRFGRLVGGGFISVSEPGASGRRVGAGQSVGWSDPHHVA